MFTWGGLKFIGVHTRMRGIFEQWKGELMLSVLSNVGRIFRFSWNWAKYWPEDDGLAGAFRAVIDGFLGGALVLRISGDMLVFAQCRDRSLYVSLESLSKRELALLADMVRASRPVRSMLELVEYDFGEVRAGSELLAARERACAGAAIGVALAACSGLPDEKASTALLAVLSKFVRPEIPRFSTGAMQSLITAYNSVKLKRALWRALA